MTGHQERSIKRFVRTVDRNAKCHSSPQKDGQSSVKRVGRNIDRHEETDTTVKIGYTVGTEAS